MEKSTPKPDETKPCTMENLKTKTEMLRSSTAHGNPDPSALLEHDYISTTIHESNKELFQELDDQDPEFCAHLRDLTEQPKAKNLQYFHSARVLEYENHISSYQQKSGPARSLSKEEEMFATLYRLKSGHSVTECARRIGVSVATFSRVFSTWVTFLSLELELLCKNAVADDPPDTDGCFDLFYNLRIILDCTELFSETPTSLENHKQFHSNYKHHSTGKFMVGISPTGAVTYVSALYGGRASDKFITQDIVDLLKALDPGQKVIVDRGFTIAEDLKVETESVDKSRG
ncbi:hypothetical protein ScPMuIL_014045 [Solemya velum]